MCHYSEFAPYGLLFYGEDDATAEVIYGELRRAHGPALNGAVGGPAEADDYATAIEIACAKESVERAGAQTDPAQLMPEVLPIREWETSCVPSPRATLDERRAAVKARDLVSRGSRRENVLASLELVLGDHLVAVYVTPNSDIHWAPPNPGNLSGNWIKGGLAKARKLFRTIDSVPTIGVRTLAYEQVEGAESSETLERLERVVINPENKARCEVVQIITCTPAIEATEDDPAVPATFTANFTKAHNGEVLLTTQRFPVQSTSKRHCLVVVSEAALLDPELLRKTHEVMRGVSRGVSRWSIVGENSPGAGVAGPFKVGVGLLGITPIQAVSW